MRRILIGIVVVSVLSGCVGYIKIERSERFLKEGMGQSKIICIDPQVKVIGDQRYVDREKVWELEDWMKEEILYSVQRLDLDLELATIETEPNASYYEDLLSLKKELLQANNYQSTPLNFSTAGGINSIKKSVFVYPPRIAHDYVSLSKKYGTPYFSYMGFYKESGKLIYYHLLVNTNTAETVYRELKIIPGGGLKKKNISQMVYDSMAMLKRN